MTVAVLRRWTGPEAAGWLHHHLADHGLGNMLLRRDGLVVAVLPEAEETQELVLRELSATFDIGLSEPVAEMEGLATGLLEARWALDSDAPDGARVRRYAERHAEFGPRSVAEARLTVDRILGPILRWDAEHDTHLLASLEAFLRHNRSWVRAGEELYVHKQTLVYRMRRVEELTGRRLNQTADVTILWIALEAHRRIA